MNVPSGSYFRNSFKNHPLYDYNEMNVQTLFVKCIEKMLENDKNKPQFIIRHNRAVHTTPKSYLSFIQLYKDVYRGKYNEIDKEARNVVLGLSKLKEAKEDVEKLQIELKIKEKKLEEAKRKADEVLEQVTESKQKTLQKKTEVEKEKNEIQKEYEIVNQGKKDAEIDLAKNKPLLERAEKAVSSITAKDIQTVKAYTVPPILVKVVFDGVLILRQFPINDVKYTSDDKFGTLLEDSYLMSAQKMCADAAFLKNVKEFKTDEINDETVELLKPYLRYSFFNADVVKGSSSAASALCTWVVAMAEYHEAEKVVRPKMEALREAEEKLMLSTMQLNKKLEELQKIEAEYQEKQRIYDEEMRKKDELEQDAERTRRFMEQATNLIFSLQDESDRWNKQSNQFADRLRKLTGDVALACAFISYCGPFNNEFRKILLSKYYQDCKERGIPVSEEEKDEKKDKIVDLLTTEAQIGAWNLEGLPTDNHSIQNAIMVTKASKWPLLVDPQGQGLSWLKKKYEKENLRVARLTDKYFRTVLEEAISNGYPLIIENVEEEIDPMLDPLLEKSFVMTGKQKQVIIQDKAIDYDDKFLLFLTTKISNPNFSPELFAKCNIIDFAVTMTGLEQQLLGYVIQQEKAELEEQREKILEDINHNQRIMAELEQRLLSKLSEESDKSLIEDEELIADTEERINRARNEYEDVAIRGSVLYFLIVEMSLVSTMYQTSLPQFLHLFDRGIKSAPQAPVTNQRIQNIKESCTYLTYRYISRGLFKRHKFLYLLLLACKIQLREGKLSSDEFGILLRGGAMLDINRVKQRVDWLGDIPWLNIVSLSSLETFKQLPDKLHKNDKLWRKFYDEEKPEEIKVPEYSNLTEFEKLLLIRSIREDRTILAAMQYIKSAIGQKYLDVAPTSLEGTWKESDNRTPLVCLLSPGSDPTTAIEGLARNQKKEVLSISLGQGQEPRATELINSGFSTECRNIHPDFRLWIMSKPHPKFPIGLLQVSIKLTLKEDVGIKAGMKNAFEWADMLDASKRPEWKSLIYTIYFLSTIVSERSDDSKKGPTISWPTVRYMICDVHYGGKITDERDRHLFKTYGEKWLVSEVCKPEFKFTDDYTIPFVDKATRIPVIDNLEVFGLHLNADITYKTDESKSVLSTILYIQPKESSDSSGETREDAVLKKADDFLKTLPNDFIRDQVDQNIKRLNSINRNSFNVFLSQEIDRLQKLLSVVRSDLLNLKLAIDGAIIMSAGLQDILNNIYDGRVSNSWKKLS
ncbi:hypothetical protein ABK040_001318 [Willaertia magna]